MEKEIIERAMQKDLDAQEEIIRSIHDLIFNLSLRMLGDVEDAKDATQDILLRVLENLPTFRYESKLSTWAYRVAINYLLRTREKRSRYEGISFEIYAMDLVPEHFDVPYESNHEDALLTEELKNTCSNVMLQCLDERSRCVYVLGTMFHLDAKRGAEIMEITPENYRQILSRAKKKMREFLKSYCMEEGNCSCFRRIGHAIRTHRLDPHNCHYATLKQLPKEVLSAHTERMEQLETESDMFSQMPYYQSEDVLQRVLQKLQEESPCH